MTRDVDLALSPNQLAELILKYGEQPDPGRCTARFPLCNLMCRVSAPGHEPDGGGRVMDASLGGMGIEATLDLAAGEEVTVQIDGAAFTGLELQARVMWVRPKDDGRTVRIGVRYTETKTSVA